MRDLTFYDAFLQRADTPTRDVRSWRNGEGPLLILEAGGSAPPATDEEPPDHEITLTELLTASRNLSPEINARIDRECERQRSLPYKERLQEMREFQAKKNALRPQWAEFYDRNGMPEHGARMRTPPDLPPAA